MKLPHWRDYPDEIWIWGGGRNHRWEIEFNRKMKDWGRCHFPDRMIELKVIGSRKELLKTLIHEVIHAIEFENMISIPHEFVHLLEEPVYQLVLRYSFHQGKGTHRLRR